MLSPDGEHIRTVGRDGEGPGEFRGANGLGWGPNGRLWVVDQRLKRYSVFDTSGTLLDSHQAPMSIRSWEWSGGFTRNGILYDRGHTLNGDDIVNVLLKFDMAGEYSDTFPLPLYQAEYFQWRTEYGPNMKQVPYSPLWVWMLAPDGDIRAGSSDDYRIHHLSLQADTLRIIKREYDPIPVTDAEREAAIEDVREFMRGRQFDADRVPMAKPAFERFTVDDSGFLWVKLPDSPVRQGSLVDVFDPEGRFLGTMVTSAQMSRYLRFIVRGDVLCYVTVDELDVPYVVTERITGR